MVNNSCCFLLDIKFIYESFVNNIGTMSDLRNSNTENNDQNNKKFISTNEGEKLKNDIKAVKYIETSALTQDNVNQVFESCIAAYNNQKKSEMNKSCFSSIFSCF
jgi:hypothetical protein